jgi:hypothetical protein
MMKNSRSIKKDGVIVDWCPYYEYVEILGLPKRDFEIIERECGDNE